MTAAIGISRERAAMVLFWSLAGLAWLLGLVASPSAATHGTAEQALDLVRVAATIGLAVTLLLGPAMPPAP